MFWSKNGYVDQQAIRSAAADGVVGAVGGVRVGPAAGTGSRRIDRWRGRRRLRRRPSCHTVPQRPVAAATFRPRFLLQDLLPKQPSMPWSLKRLSDLYTRETRQLCVCVCTQAHFDAIILLNSHTVIVVMILKLRYNDNLMGLSLYCLISLLLSL